MNAKQHLTLFTGDATHNGFKKRSDMIEADTRYTLEGKEPLRRALAKEIDAEIEALKVDMPAEYKAVKAESDRHEAARNEARAKWEAGWDFQRLNYAGQQVTAQIREFKDHEANGVRKAWEAAQGDPYKVRAWGEIGAGLLGRFGEGALIEDTKRAAEALARTPEAVKAEEAEGVMASRMIDLQKTTRAIATELGGLGRSHQVSFLEGLANSIHVSQKWETDGILTHVEMDDAPARVSNIVVADYVR